MMQGQLMAAWSPFGAKLAERNMNWLTNVVRPKIRSMLRRKVRKNLWIKCPDTEQLVLRDHGMVDMVVHRHDMLPTLARLCRLLTKLPPAQAAAKRAPTIRIPAQAEIWSEA
jgi:acetyl-CoA carboxylase beta subunit